MIELAALDMAGTTIDGHGDVYEALREAAAEAGGRPDEATVRRWMGTDKRAAIAALAAAGGGPTLDGPAVEAGYQRFRTLLEARYRAIPPVPVAGVPEALAALRERGVKVALTTGFAGDVVEPLLASLGWKVGGDLIDAVVCTDDVPAGRPAPYLVFRAMERTGVTAVDRVLVAGDTPADLRSGVNAGAALVVGVGTGAVGLAELGRERHTHLLPSLAELPHLLDAVDGTDDRQPRPGVR